MRIAFFVHSLLSDWNHGNAHFLRGVAGELISRGHDVRVFEPRDAWSLQNLLTDHGEAALAGFHAAYPNLTSQRCATPIISDEWPGLGTFFRIGEEILTARTPGQVLQYLQGIPEEERRVLGERARARVLREHTAAHRAEELEGYALSLLDRHVAA